MIPVVEIPPAMEGAEPTDRRKRRKVCWKEARLSLAHAQGSKTPCFAGTLESVETAGKQLYVLQKRLKIAGAWWKIDNAKSMINLCVCRANNRWQDYWSPQSSIKPQF
ncbi:MAG: hypothetical protein JSR33_09615 [Proteobacteria bacterium]|nr:hypothetical protein [Pseudomonadota bacterium]